MDSILQSAWDDQPRRVERDTSGFGEQQGELFRRVQSQGGAAEDQGGYVKVTVDARGRVESIELDQRLSATEMQKLGPHIAAVCARAFDQRVEQIGKLVAANADYLDRTVVDEVAALTGWLRGQ
ncbi:YbaB/EbfC family nucleoid-associated protein [Mycobacteroides chelonae]|uniref:YbaB/EbfC family nucleoid-associated protein n=1 Tax=Mycobacteroides chelonae TaxID=1774 RepID=UPI000993A682|nr:YbaB/EbfC family nucleoid-associated protein [Mycobacteroides chelonae]